MLAAARSASPGAGVVFADAAALPLADNVADVTLAAHMLYHVPDRPAAVREFRRITSPGGRVLVVLSAPDHLAELHELVEAAAADIAVPAEAIWTETRADGHGLNLDAGAALLLTEFGTVERHDFVTELVVPGPHPVLDYVASTRFAQGLANPTRLIDAVARRLSAGVVTIRTHCGVLVCR
jgi:SAM-dependent methyltransferase